MHGADFFFVSSADGTRLAAERAGPAAGQGVILIHGVLHSRLIFKKQFADPALSKQRLLAFDVRGHGDSDKPAARDAYDAERYADDLDAIIKASGFEKPIVLGWSLGSRVMFGYLAKHGWSKLGGLMIVGARMKTDNVRVQSNDALDASLSDDLGRRIPGRTAFVRACHEVPPTESELGEIVAAAMVMPPQVLRNIAGRPLDNEALMAKLDLPIRIVQGEKDAVNLTYHAEAAAKLNPRAELSLYENIGHSPFFEAPERFNKELLDFARICEIR
jgi:non-heme chloroperoxidase